MHVLMLPPLLACRCLCRCCRRYNFAAREEEVALLRALTLPQLLAAWRAALSPASATRRKLAVHVAGRGHQGDLEAAPANGVGVFGDADAVRGACRMQPAPQGRLPALQG